jgi:hypothetical protein
MEKKPIARKSMGVFIALLFVGISLAPMMSGLSIEKSIWDVQLCENGVRDENDTTPPVTTISFDPPVPNGQNGWYVSDVMVTLNATDNDSGVWRTFCSISPGGNYTEPILVSQDGIYEITFYSIDYAGNVEVMKSAFLKIDKTPPKGIVDLTLEKVGSVYNMIITVTCLDENNSIAKVEFYFNGALQETITGAGPEYVWTYQYIPLLTSFTIKVVVYDTAGNIYVVEITFGPRTFFTGLITDLNDTGRGIISFKAKFVFFVLFHPFDMGRVIPQEEIFVIRDYQGYLGPRFIVGIFSTISIEYP